MPPQTPDPERTSPLQPPWRENGQSKVPAMLPHTIKGIAQARRVRVPAPLGVPAPQTFASRIVQLVVCDGCLSLHHQLDQALRDRPVQNGTPLFELEGLPRNLFAHVRASILDRHDLRRSSFAVRLKTIQGWTSSNYSLLLIAPYRSKGIPEFARSSYWSSSRVCSQLVSTSRREQSRLGGSHAKGLPVGRMQLDENPRKQLGSQGIIHP